MASILPSAPLLQGMPITDARAQNALPTTNQPWPPVRFNPVNYDQRIWSAWWSGSPDELMRAYYSIGANSPLGRQYFATTGEAGLPAPRPGQFRGGLLGSIRRFFWLPNEVTQPRQGRSARITTFRSPATSRRPRRGCCSLSRRR